MGMLIDNTHADNVHSFIRGGESQSTLFLDGRKTRGLPPLARPFSLTSTRHQPSAGKRFRPGAGGDPLQKRRRGAEAANDSDYGLGAAV